MTQAIRVPDLSARPFGLSVERFVKASPAAIYAAWTSGMDRWFAAPGSVLMKAEVNAPFFYETEFRPENAQKASRHPHYGRFLRLEKDRWVELTWVTGPSGTAGAETVVTVELVPQGSGTLVKLTHAGFADEKACDKHRQAWPFVLEQLDLKIS